MDRITQRLSYRIDVYLIYEDLTLYVRKQVLKCYIESIMLYKSEYLNENTNATKSLEALEMWFLISIFRIIWTTTISGNDYK